MAKDYVHQKGQVALGMQRTATDTHHVSVDLISQDGHTLP